MISRSYKIWLRKAGRWIRRNAGGIIAASALVVSITALAINYLSSIRSERAYVSATAANAFNFNANGAPLQTYVLISNSGKTLAQIISIEVGIAILESLPDTLAKVGKLQIEPGKFTAWPNQPYVTFRTFDVLSEAQVENVLRSREKIFVVGKIQYKDIYGYLRQTLFCHMYSGSETADFPVNGGRGYTGFQARYCDKYNEAN